MIIEVNGEYPQPRRLKEAVERLRRGELVAYPTDTVYAIGCDLRQKAAAKELYRLKELHHADKKSAVSAAASLVVPDLGSIATWAIVEDADYRLLRRALPGPYTFILRASREVPRLLFKKRRHVGIRVPSSPVAQALCEALGGALLSTTARDLDGELLFEPRSIEAAYHNSVSVVLDAGPLIPQPSTVIDLTEGAPVVLREGKGDLAQIGLA